MPKRGSNIGYLNANYLRLDGTNVMTGAVHFDLTANDECLVINSIADAWAFRYNASLAPGVPDGTGLFFDLTTDLAYEFKIGNVDYLKVSNPGNANMLATVMSGATLFDGSSLLTAAGGYQTRGLFQATDTGDATNYIGLWARADTTRDANENVAFICEALGAGSFGFNMFGGSAATSCSGNIIIGYFNSYGLSIQQLDNNATAEVLDLRQSGTADNTQWRDGSTLISAINDTGQLYFRNTNEAKIYYNGDGGTINDTLSANGLEFNGNRMVVATNFLYFRDTGNYIQGYLAAGLRLASTNLSFYSNNHYFGTAAAGANILMYFDGETNKGSFTWMEDEDLFSFSDKVLLDFSVTGAATHKYHEVQTEITGTVATNVTAYRATLQDNSSSNVGHIKIGLDVDNTMKHNQVDGTWEDYGAYLDMGSLAEIPGEEFEVDYELYGAYIKRSSICVGDALGGSWNDIAAFGLYLEGWAGTSDDDAGIAGTFTRYAIYSEDGDVYFNDCNLTNEGNVTITSTNYLYFRDTAISISSATDGHLDLAADVSIDFNSLAFNFGLDTGDVTFTVLGNPNDGAFKWWTDEDYFEFQDSILMSLSEPLYFKNTGSYIYNDGANLTLVDDAQININAAIVDINASTGLALDGANLNSNWLVNTTNRIQFRDSAIYIYSNADGWLNLVADIGVELNTVTVNATEFYCAGDITGDYIATGGNELLATDIIRHTVTAGDAAANNLTEAWNTATQAKVANLRAVFLDLSPAPDVVWADDWTAGGADNSVKYDGTTITVYDQNNVWAENDIVTIYIVYEK